jgi:hypothetical protein
MLVVLLLLPLFLAMNDGKFDHGGGGGGGGGPAARLHIPAGILRIPVFSVPVAFFSQ